MSNVRDLGRKIQSLKNMQKVTRAMNMISSIKLKKYMQLQDSLNIFMEQTDHICSTLYRTLEECLSPVVQGYDDEKIIRIILFTADKGLCGNHNSTLLKAADAFIHEKKSMGKEVEVSCFGIKGINHGKREDWNLIHQIEMNERTLNQDSLNTIADEIFEHYMQGKIHKVVVLGKIFRSTLQQDTERQQLLPLLPGKEQASGGSLQMEPEGENMAREYGYNFLKDKMQIFMNNSFLSEYSSRLTAMENATNNSEDLIDKYVTMQNHARQANITNELIEIVSGKEALKG